MSQSDNKKEGGEDAALFLLINNLSRSVEKLSQNVSEKLKQHESDMDKRLAKMEQQLDTLTNREAIMADAKIRTQHTIMWNAFLAMCGIVGTGIVGALLYLVIKSPP